MVVNLGAPVQVSPLIRGCRWGALVLGIVYGTMRYSYIQRKEVKIQERDNKIREEYNKITKATNEKKTKIEMDQLAKDVGIVKVA